MISERIKKEFSNLKDYIEKGKKEVEQALKGDKSKIQTPEVRQLRKQLKRNQRKLARMIKVYGNPFKKEEAKESSDNAEGQAPEAKAE